MHVESFILKELHTHESKKMKYKFVNDNKKI